MSGSVAQEVLVDAFEDAALVLGGIFAVHGVDDEVVWQAAKNLSVIYRKAREALRNAGRDGRRQADARNHEPHPAIVELLTQIRRDRKSPLCEATEPQVREP